MVTYMHPFMDRLKKTRTFQKGPNGFSLTALATVDDGAVVRCVPTVAVLAAAQAIQTRLAEGATIAVRHQATLNVGVFGKLGHIDWPGALWADRTSTTGRLGAGAGTA